MAISYHVILNYNIKIVTLRMPRMDNLGEEGVYMPKPMKIIYFIKAKRLVGRRFLIFLAYL